VGAPIINTRMSVVWIFKDPRSGSTAFTNLVSNRLNRIEKFLGGHTKDIELIKHILNPEDYVFCTHSYDFIEIMNLFDKPPILVRCTRQDKLESCLSFLIATYKTKRIRHEDFSWNIMRSDVSAHNNFIDGIEPTIFTKKEVYSYLQYQTKINQYWENKVSLYQNCTVFYEDLCTDIGVDLPALGLTSLSIATTDSVTIKIPDYKKQVCLNYDMISNWVTEYYTEHKY
jgi:hypothetical protein